VIVLDIREERGGGRKDKISATRKLEPRKIVASGGCDAERISGPVILCC
jgi:hypothetical protein